MGSTTLKELFLKRAEENKRLQNSISPGSASIDVTASVGQTIVVEEVDANGKVTKVKAADYQQKICGIGLVEIVPETVVECEDSDMDGDGTPDGVYMGMIMQSFPFTAGQKCLVSYNGTEYECECVVMDDSGTLAFGNMMAFGDEDTGEPFTCTYMDTDGTGTMALMILALDGSATVALSIKSEMRKKISTEWVPTLEEMRTVYPDVTILEETSYTWPTNNPVCRFLNGQTIIEGQTYEVTYNGTVYSRVAKNLNSIIYIGNLMAFDGEDTGEPFIIWVEGNLICIADVANYISDTKTEVSATFGIVAKNVETVYPIPEKFYTGTKIVHIGTVKLNESGTYSNIADATYAELLSWLKNGFYIIAEVNSMFYAPLTQTPITSKNELTFIGRYYEREVTVDINNDDTVTVSSYVRNDMLNNKIDDRLRALGLIS